MVEMHLVGMDKVCTALNTDLTRGLDEGFAMSMPAPRLPLPPFLSRLKIGITETGLIPILIWIYLVAFYDNS
jgi:hypothetical protein